jgi:hypothetical protein
MGRVLAATVLLALAVALAAPTAGAAPASVPTKKLAKLVDKFSKRYGIERHSLGAIKRAHLSRKVTKRLAAELRALRSCDRLTRKAARELKQAGIQGLRGDAPKRVAAKYAGDIKQCAKAVRSRANAFKRRGSASGSASGPLDLWPVLHYEPGTADNTYVNDYALLIDRGGNDRYFNNAGGSVLDVFRGPPGSLAPIVAPAHGCEGGFDIVRPTLCVLSNAVLVDDAGNDGYGRRESPRFDAFCTADPVVRRFFTAGMGLAGVGVLVDRAGDDTYVGKTLSIGAGHIGGIGVLRDLSGNDSYSAVRTSIGSASVTGLGRFIDSAGNDRYDYYSPSPLNPAAPNLAPGAGGVNDELERCDRTNRQLDGSGNVLGIGIFSDSAGTDSYHAPANSLGFGGAGGFGYFTDGGGATDSYTGPGAAGRGNNITLGPTTGNQGTFRDQ